MGLYDLNRRQRDRLGADGQHPPPRSALLQKPGTQWPIPGQTLSSVDQVALNRLEASLKANW
jgi:hypothetical protein